MVRFTLFEFKHFKLELGALRISEVVYTETKFFF